jgi:DNA-binding IclR family transcriptional regulator
MPKVTDPTFAPADGVAAVDRAIAIVLALEAAARPLTLAELAKGTNLYKSTLLRLMASLERSALVVRTSEQKYRLGPLAFRLGRAFDATYHVKDAVLPVLEWLVEQGTESASFHVWHDSDTRLCLFRIDSNHATLDRVRAGALLPMSVGAPGKVLLAYHNRRPSSAAPAPLIQVSFGERDPLCGAIACPVFGADGEMVGALSLSGPLERFSKSSVKKMSEPLAKAAEMATRALGGHWPASEAQAAPYPPGVRRK